MTLPRLTVWMRDGRSGTTTIRSFCRSPVTIGHGPDNTIRFEAHEADRHHGAFFFATGSVEYVDLGSRAGTRIDGTLLVEDSPTPLVDVSAIVIGPFEIRVRLQGLDLSSGSSLGFTEMLAGEGRPAPSGATWPTEASGSSAALPSVVFRVGPLALLARTLQVVEAVAGAIAEARSPSAASRSVLLAADDPEDIIMYLIDPSGPDGRLDELVAVLTEMVRGADSLHEKDRLS